MNPYQSAIPIGRESFGQLVAAEWTKLRSVRGMKIGVLLAIVLTVAIAILTGSGSKSSINGAPGHPFVPTGPGGESVSDTFYFVSQPLTGDGTLTARITSLTGLATPGEVFCTGPPPNGPNGGSPSPVPSGTGQPQGQGQGQGLPPNCHANAGGTGPRVAQPWAKAGLIVKSSSTPGSAYAAAMVTHSDGVRMQWNYLNDVPGLAGAVSAKDPRWLRLTRSGDIVTGYDSTDGRKWTEIDSVTLPGLPATVQIGMFATSPKVDVVRGHDGITFPSQVKATFDHVALSTANNTAGAAWRGFMFGNSGNVAYPSVGGYFHSNGDTFTLAGSGDIAPAAIGGPGGAGQPVEMTLIGAFLGLLVLIVLGSVFITGEYRRGLIRTTLAASPRRGRVVASKAVVVGAVGFVVGVVASVVCVTVGAHLLRSNGNLIYPVSTMTEIRLVIGVGAVLALGSVMALAAGTVLRHAAGVIVGLLVLFVLPEFLSLAAVLPPTAGEWLLRLTPAAGFAVEQSLQPFSQVSDPYWPQFGYYPLPAWGGLLVLCAYVAVALGVANHLLARRDV